MRIDTILGALVAAWVIVSPVIILALTAALIVCRGLRGRPADTCSFWEMQPGRRYHIEIWPSGENPFDFIDEFIGFHHHDADFRLHTLHRQLTDQVRVTPLPPPKRKRRGRR